jgi:hypothetical protein
VALLILAASSFARADESRCAAISRAIAPRFENVWLFADAVAVDGKWGYIDKQGKEVMAPRFENHLTAVRVSDK